jgi:two-component system, OmpR family, alkaline phosphatase synthesis response regulator PhoP
MKRGCGSWHAGSKKGSGIREKRGAKGDNDMLHAVRKYRRADILIADDDEVCRVFCHRSLALQEGRIHTATTGKSAISLAIKHQPGVVLMDMHFSDMFGVDVIAAIHSKWPASRAATCFIGMTADDSPGAAYAMRAAGCRAVLAKPFSSQVLLACIRETSGLSSRPVPAQREQATVLQLQTRFYASLGCQLAELDAAITRLDWTEAQRLVHQLSGAAALAGLCQVAQSGRALLRRLPSAGSGSTIADSYLFFLDRVADVPRG